jgi:ribonuclease P protein component
MKSKITTLSKNVEFKSLLSGKKISNKYSSIYFKRLSGKNSNRLNISFVAKKKLGNAVIRNKIKRRLRNIMNEACKKIDINLNYSYLLVAKKMIFDDKYTNVKKNLLIDFKKIK